MSTIYNSHSANINSIRLVVASAGTPQLLGSLGQRFKGIVFQGFKGDPTVPNAQVAYIQLRAMGANGEIGDWEDTIPVPKGLYTAGVNVHSDAARWFNATQFRVRVLADGDGVIGIPIS